MSDMEFVPELTRPPGHQTLRDQLNQCQAALAEANMARERAEADATQLAEFIAARVGASVWRHDDVLRIVSGVVRALLENPVATMADAKAKGIPPTYTAMAALLTRRAVEVRAEIMAALASGDLDPQRAASDEMREHLLAQLPSEDEIARAPRS